MANPESDLVDHIASDLSLVKGRDICDGWVRPPSAYLEEKCVFIFPTGGPIPDNYLGGTGKIKRRSDLQIRVRGKQDDPDGAIVFAREVRDSAHHAVISGYLEVEVQVSEPQSLGPDRQGLPEYSLPVRMIRVEP